jgi:signal transduction histidine kinase/CheY-like chemotaxis protein/HPt (histidine-containing phosphotransfer) domain-containing protein
MLHLTQDQIEHLFPFYFKIGVGGKTISLGSSLAKLLDAAKIELSELRITSVDPVTPLHSLELKGFDHFSFTINLDGVDCAFKGVLNDFDNNKEFVFLGSPFLIGSDGARLLQKMDIEWGTNDSIRVLLEEIEQLHFVRSEMSQVSERLMKYHEELIDTSARLNTLIDSLDSAVLSESSNRMIVMVNRLFCSLFCMEGDPDTFIGMDCSKAAHFAKHLFSDPDAFVAGVERLVKVRQKVIGELLYLKDGRVLERDFIPVFEHGEYAGHTWKYQDVTEILHDKESLIKTEDKYSRIIENLRFGLVEVDLNEVITKVYPAFCELTGYTEAELIGQNARDLLALKEDLEDSQQLNRKRQEGVSNVSGAPIYNDRNEVIGSMGIHVDITERKLLEQDLISAKEAALASMKAKEMFLANMSHEIRTPMNVIIGMTDLISDSHLDADQRKYINAVQTSADNLLGLINDILDFSKIEAGHLNLEEVTTDLSQLFDQLELGFAELASKKSVGLSVHMDENISTELLVDPGKLNQVLVNLMSNAIKFTEVGQVEISAILLTESEDEQHILFKVVDSGIGIDKSNLEQIFNTFMQEDAGVSRKFGGTGLGLSISRSIVRRMGGDISVKSQKGQGSEFYFDLKLKRVPEEENDTITPKVNSPLGSVRVLVAEDNELNRLLITSILRKESVFHRIAENGLQAIELLKEDSFDIVLMDIQMPEMDGVSATRRIREEMNMTIPIVALTANATADDTRNYLRVGMNAHIPKPFKKEQLFNMIGELLQLNLSPNLQEEMVSGSSSIYSTVELEQIGGGDEQFVRSVLQTFISTVPPQLVSIEKAVSHTDLQSVRHIAHQLKPSIDLLHLHSVKELVRSIEKEASGTAPDLFKMADEVTQFVTEMYLIVSAVEYHLDQ